MSLFNPTRDQARLFFIDAWRKHIGKNVLTPLEIQAVDIVQSHPEYHALLQAEDVLQRDWSPESGELNPFLHLSLHLAIAEQLQINQPPGIREAFETLRDRYGDPHPALHDILECLGESLWTAQQNKCPPDGEAYLACIQRKAQQ